MLIIGSQKKAQWLCEHVGLAETQFPFPEPTYWLTSVNDYNSKMHMI